MQPEEGSLGGQPAAVLALISTWLLRGLQATLRHPWLSLLKTLTLLDIPQPPSLALGLREALLESG